MQELLRHRPEKQRAKPAEPPGPRHQQGRLGRRVQQGLHGEIAHDPAFHARGPVPAERLLDVAVEGCPGAAVVVLGVELRAATRVVLVQEVPGQHGRQGPAVPVGLCRGPHEGTGSTLGSVNANHDVFHADSVARVTDARAGPAGRPTRDQWPFCPPGAQAIVLSSGEGSRHGSPIQRLLVPMDLSAEAERAIEPAVRLGQRAGAPVVLFSWVFDEGDPSEAVEAKRHLLDVAGKLPGIVTVEVAMTVDASPARQIVAAATRASATVCMASHGRRGVGRAFLGSVAEETLRLLRRPSLLVGPLVDWEPIGQSPTVVACVDGTPLSETVLPVAADWVRQLRRPLQVVNVVEPAVGYGPPGEGPVEHGYLACLVAGLDTGEPVDYEVLHGRPAEAIAAFAGTRAELVAVASHSRHGLARSVLGRVAMDIVHRSQRPVLVVPAHRED